MKRPVRNLIRDFLRDKHYPLAERALLISAWNLMAYGVELGPTLAIGLARLRNQ